MKDLFGSFFKQPYWVVTLVLGVLLVISQNAAVDFKGFKWSPPAAHSFLYLGVALILLSALAFTCSIVLEQLKGKKSAWDGIDLARVKENNGAMSTVVNGCEIRVVTGRIEEYASGVGHAVVLPCNEYFDDRCIEDTRSALGAFVNRAYEGQVPAFTSLMREECKRRFGTGVERQKTADERAESFGVGKCLLFVKPLGRSLPIALVSTTTQRADEGLSSRISYLFEAMQQLVACLANERINEAVIPVLGAGHGGIETPLAFVGLLLAVAEASRGQGTRRLKKVTIVVFKKDANSEASVNEVVVRRALALIGSPQLERTSE